MKYLVFWLSFLVIASCKKEDKQHYFVKEVSYKADGQLKTAGPPSWTGVGQFECALIGDSALFIVAGSSPTIVFYIKDKLFQGTYSLDATNKAYYEPTQQIAYQTTANYTGSITLNKTTGQIRGGSLANVLVGTFSFTAIDTTNGKVIKITDGKLAMPRNFN